MMNVVLLLLMITAIDDFILPLLWKRGFGLSKDVSIGLSLHQTLMYHHYNHNHP